MGHQEAMLYLKNNLEKFQELNPTSIFIVSPFLHKDLVQFMKDINEKGINNINVQDYSTDGQFGVYTFDYRALKG
ncbi:hypothetical protein [Flavobacterium gawalongense]|uniref:Uncharacterized protein n=1 Tax=Flavobacterium gawalongense TaxID=2594432 RepID=A0A553BS18_9FLAO|nr:hypothetical protein [Flavobacterium gawalongense]TRX11050.1 hypothetical protein FNW11_06645 [Flavobacterium gawalongense]TRX11987.1 hypothetical protein FNW10_05730 [Flavobacterium gawalongense]TRX29833.1 hypothetical protein FNW38_05825 [Flavobacterium gawalongense]